MKKILRNVLIVICLCTFCFSAYKIFDYYYGTYKNKKMINDLTELIKDDNQGKKMTFSEQYSNLLKQNSDMIGWINIPDSNVNYPVMQTPLDEEFYLRRGFDTSWEMRGSLFLNKEADIKNESDNMIIYGHNMNDHTMFGDLDKYKDKDFYLKHKTFTFDTVYHRSTYEIFAVFKMVDEKDSDTYIDYYNFFNITDANEFNNQINRYKTMSFYDTGITPEFGDKLLTLSTCEYSKENGRLVVVARKVESNEEKN